jgi:hypothetical protein
MRMGEKFYSKEEVDRILKRALESSPSHGNLISETELLRIASELNIDPFLVRRAMSEDGSILEFENAKEVWRRRKKQSFYQHLATYVIVNGFLVGIDFVTSGSFSWSIFPILGWGIGLALDFVESIFPSEEKVEKGAQKLMNSKKWKGIFNNLIDSFTK